MTTIDALRLPSRLDATAPAYKDWLHLNVLDHASGCVGLVNVSLHGAPDDPASRAVGVALINSPDGWIGNAEVAGIGDAALGPASIALERVAIAVDSARGEIAASADLPDDALTVELTASTAAAPVFAEQRLPLGSGWISWLGIPRVMPHGTARVGKRLLDLEGASAYHDHNWGRWHWGDDFGWEWGCFLPPHPAPAFVLSRVTDRSHRRVEGPLVVVAYASNRRRWFVGETVQLDYSGTLAAAPRRVPGAMAALHQDRAAPRVPARLEVRADDGIDRVELDFAARACAQLIAADPAERGYGFIHELVGEFAFACRLGDETSEGRGLAVVEYVD